MKWLSTEKLLGLQLEHSYRWVSSCRIYWAGSEREARLLEGGNCPHGQGSILAEASHCQEASRQHTVLDVSFFCQHPPPVLQLTETTTKQKSHSLFFTKWRNDIFPASPPRHPLECQPFRSMLGQTTPEKKPALPILQVEESFKCKRFPLHLSDRKCLGYFLYGLCSCIEKYSASSRLNRRGAELH